MKRLWSSLIVLILLVIPASALAFGMANGQTVVVPAGESRSGTYFATGNQITVAGTINGDLVCAGTNVTITGAVHGDVLCAGQVITLTGTVDGSVRLAGQNLGIGGMVGRNVMAAGQTITTKSDLAVAGDAGFFGQTVDLTGKISHDLYGAMQTLSLDAEAGPVSVALQTLSLGSNARVNGNLDYTSDRSANLDQSRVTGGVKFTKMTRNGQSATSQATASIATKLYFLLASLVTVAAIILVAPGWLRRCTDLMLTRPAATLGWGTVTLLAAPITLIVLTLTFIGLPLALLAGGFLTAAIAVAPIFAGLAAAVWGLRQTGTAQKSLWWAAVVGGIGMALLLAIPLLGGVIWFLSAAWTLGAFAVMLTQSRRDHAKAHA